MTADRSMEPISDEKFAEQLNYYNDDNIYVYNTGGTNNRMRKTSLRYNSLNTIRNDEPPQHITELIQRAARIKEGVGYDPKTVVNGLRLHAGAKPCVFFMLEKDENGDFVAAKDIENPHGYARFLRQGEVVIRCGSTKGHGRTARVAAS